MLIKILNSEFGADAVGHGEDIFTLKFGWIPVDPSFALFGSQGVTHIALSIEERSVPASQFGYEWKAHGVPRIDFRPERPVIMNIQ